MKRPIEFVLTVYQDSSISYKILEEIGIEIETMLDGELTGLQNEIQKLFDKMLSDRINHQMNRTEEFDAWYKLQDADFKEDCDAWSASQGWCAAIDTVIAEWEKPWVHSNGQKFIDRLRSMQTKVRMYKL